MLPEYKIYCQKEVVCRAGKTITLTLHHLDWIVVTDGPFLVDGKPNEDAILTNINIKYPELSNSSFHCKDCPFDVGCRIIEGKRLEEQKPTDKLISS